MYFCFLLVTFFVVGKLAYSFAVFVYLMNLRSGSYQLWFLRILLLQPCRSLMCPQNTLGIGFTPFGLTAALQFFLVHPPFAASRKQSSTLLLLCRPGTRNHPFCQIWPCKPSHLVLLLPWQQRSMAIRFQFGQWILVGLFFVVVALTASTI